MREKNEQSQRGAPGDPPQVGIFWNVNGRLILDSVSLAAAEAYGEFLNYPDGHEEVWKSHQGAGTVPSDMEYDGPPRGRVVFNAASKWFLLYADACILPDRAMMNEIRWKLNLPAETRASGDEHYRCPKCLVFNDK